MGTVSLVTVLNCARHGKKDINKLLTNVKVKTKFLINYADYDILPIFAAKIHKNIITMLSNRSFLEHEIPYRQLDKLGISKKSILALNKDILSTFMTGGFTPLLRMEVEGDGKTYIFLGKLRMSREPKGGVSLYVLPLRTRTPNDKDLRLDEPEMEHLRHGLILKKNVYDEFNKKTTYYAQLDGETNAILKVRARDVAIPSVVKDVDINMEMRETLRNGMPVQIDADGTPYTIGIDLTEPSGYRVLQGTRDDWDAVIAREWDKVHPEEIGFWLTDENGWEYQELSDSKLHIDMQYALDDDIDLDEALSKNQGASIRI
jgi:hypothetical protein